MPQRDLSACIIRPRSNRLLKRRPRLHKFRLPRARPGTDQRFAQNCQQLVILHTFRSGGSRNANRFRKVSCKEIFLCFRKISDLGVRCEPHRLFKIRFRAVKIIEHRKQITSLIMQPRGLREMFEAKLNHSKTLRIFLTSQESICNKQIELFIFRCKRCRSLQRFERLARLTISRIRLRKQVFDTSPHVWTGVQYCSRLEWLSRIRRCRRSKALG